MVKRVLTAVAFCLGALATHGLEFYVSPTGNDSDSGTRNAPFATVGRARDAVRSLKRRDGLPLGGVTVWLEGGIYGQTHTLSLDARDSGSADRPVIYSATSGSAARISGGTVLDPSWFQPVDPGSAVWARIDQQARGNVYWVNLRQHGISDFGALKIGGFHLHAVSALELFIDGRPMTLGRWPNSNDELARTESAPSSTQIRYFGSRPDRWRAAKDIWMHGLWNTTWADFHVQVSSIDTGKHAINLTKQPNQFGLGANFPYYVYNLLEEVDSPGEYYLDRDTGILYLWPPGPLKGSTIQASLLEEVLLDLRQTNFVVFRNLTFEATRASLIRISGGSDNRVEGCLLRNCGEFGAEVTGSRNGFADCTFADCGEDGVILGGGDRATLTPGNNFVTDCRFHRMARINWTYHPAINFDAGCGNIAAHNLIENMPHAAVLFTGNNHRIEFNEIRQVCKITNDCGAIYSGRDWSYRGNVIRSNFIHHIHSDLEGPGSMGVYLDDCMSSALIEENVFYAIDGAAVFCGGGRDNIIRSNIIAECQIGHYNGDYARGFINNVHGSPWNFLERLKADGIRYQSEPWASAYPGCASIPDSFALIEQGMWRNPEHCVFSNNGGWSNRRWMYETNFSGTGVFSVYDSIANNHPDLKPLFTEDACWDRTQRPSELAPSISGFQPIEFASIGPLASEPATAAPRPDLLIATKTAANQTELHWSHAGELPWERAAGAAVAEFNPEANSWSDVKTLGPDANTVVVTGLEASATYKFHVTRYNAAGSSLSNELSVSTSPPGRVYGQSVPFGAAQPLLVTRSVGKSGPIKAVNGPEPGGKCVAIFDPDDAIRVPFTVPADGLYRIGVRVRSGAANLPIGTEYWPNGYAFALDGSLLKMVGDPATVSELTHTFGPTYWGTMYAAPRFLTAGAHALDIVSREKWAAVDNVEVAPILDSPAQ